MSILSPVIENERLIRPGTRDALAVQRSHPVAQGMATVWRGTTDWLAERAVDVESHEVLTAPELLGAGWAHIAIERARRAQVRQLSGLLHEIVRWQIIAQGPVMMPALLEELEAVAERIDDMPVNVTSGFFEPFLMKQWQPNPHDLMLADRIQAVILDMARTVGVAEVMATMEQWPKSAASRFVELSLQDLAHAPRTSQPLA